MRIWGHINEEARKVRRRKAADAGLAIAWRRSISHSREFVVHMERSGHGRGSRMDCDSWTNWEGDLHRDEIHDARHRAIGEAAAFHQDSHICAEFLFKRVERYGHVVCGDEDGARRVYPLRVRQRFIARPLKGVVTEAR